MDATFGSEHAHLQESSACVSPALQEAHVKAVRHYAALLAMGSEETASRGKGGADAPLDAAGFRATTSLCCPHEMEMFFTRLLDSMGLQVCSWPHIQGLMHWFS